MAAQPDPPDGYGQPDQRKQPYRVKSQADGREAFVDSGAFPRDATITMVAEVYQDDVAFQLYDATRGDRTMRVVEQLRRGTGCRHVLVAGFALVFLAAGEVMLASAGNCSVWLAL
jgi:hypothetical protein